MNTWQMQHLAKIDSLYNGNMKREKNDALVKVVSMRLIYSI